MGVKSYSVKVVVVVLYFETLQVCFPTSHTLHYTLQVSAGGKRLFYVFRTDFVQSYCNFGLLTLDIAYRKYLFKTLLINETILRMFRRLRTLSGWFLGIRMFCNILFYKFFASKMTGSNLSKNIICIAAKLDFLFIKLRRQVLFLNAKLYWCLESNFKAVTFWTLNLCKIPCLNKNFWHVKGTERE